MVKLKSFRYIETDESFGQQGSSGPQPPLNSQQREPARGAALINMGPLSSSSSSSRTTIASLPSNEEYQLEKIDLGEEAEEDVQEEGETRAEEVQRKQEIENYNDKSVIDKQGQTRNNAKSPGGLRRSLTSESSLVNTPSQLQRHQQQRSSQKQNTKTNINDNNNTTNINTNAPTLVHLREQFLIELAQQQQPLVGSPRTRVISGKIVTPSSFPPLLANRPKVPQNEKALDSISQHRPSLPMSGSPEDSCFEIKWRSIYLYAKKEKIFSFSDYMRKLIGLPTTSSAAVVAAASKNGLINLASQTHNPRDPSSLSAYSTPQLKLRRSLSNQSDQLLNARGLPYSASSTPDPLDEFQSFEEYRPILHNVSGSVFSGQLTAVLGPSGVGKSSLLNTLTGRNQLAGVGRVSLLGCSDKRLSVVFVPQWDVLPEQLTTFEDLKFTSRLKNPKFSNDQHEHNINRVVKLLQLTNFLQVPIKKLSGGQARRLSIGRELLGSPDIMILDEPTSGLDANTCKKIIQALRDLTEQSDSLLDRPMSIIVTIHQPQHEVYELFHRVYLMAQGGRAIYEGPPGDLLDSFMENSALATIVAPEQLNENPAVVALEVASGEYGQTIIEDLARNHEYQHDQSPFGTPSLYLRSPKMALKTQLGLAAAAAAACANTSLNGSSSIPSSPLIAQRSANNLNNNLYNIATSEGQSPIIVNGGYRTPKMTPRFSNPKHASNQWDSKSIITTVSYASTYDAELPEPVAPKLKVDKRLRRSVVMKGDFVRQTWTLIKRSWLLATRDRFLMLIRILGFLGVASGTIHIFSESLDPNDHSCPQYVSQVDDLQSFMVDTRNRLLNIKGFLQQNVSNQMFMFNILTTVLMLTAALAGLVYPIQLRMFLREYKNGWYSPASFITSITISELLIDILGPVMLIGITYQLCHQPESQYHWREGAYVSLIILCALTMKSLSQIVAGFLRNSIEMAVFASCVTVIFPVLFSGLPVAIQNFPAWLQSVSYFSFSRWTFEGLSIARYGYDLCPCDPDKINGYPTILDQDTVPKRLHTLSQNLLNYYTSTGRENDTNIAATTLSSLLNPDGASSDLATAISTATPDADSSDNLFSQIVHMATNAANPLIETHQELGDCRTYRSLSLIQLGIEDRQLPRIFLTLGLTFIILRIITYFCVKAVIKLSRSND